MAKSMRKMLLLAKVQAVAGVDPIPDGASDAILCRGITPRPVVAETAERNLIRPYFGNSGQLPVGAHSEIEFEVELAGSGTAGTAPAWGPLLRGCAFSETIVEDTSVTYQPVSDDMEHVALHFYLDGLLHQMLDCYGTVSLELSAKGIPVLKFRFMGTYTAIRDALPPAGVNYSSFMTPSAVNTTNTPQWSLFGYTGCLQSITFDVANNLVFRALIGCEGAEITDRKPTGQIVMELPAIAALDWPARTLSADTGPLTVTHGIVPGHIIQVSAPKVQITEPSYSDQDGTAMLNANVIPQPNLGNDELLIVVK